MSYVTYLKTLAQLQFNKEKQESKMDLFDNGSSRPATQEVKGVQSRQEALELVAAYARDIVALWPQFSFRMIPAMTNKIQALKEALEMTVK